MDRFLIAPFNSGLVENVKPFLIPDDAFTSLQNSYVWRGRIKKRFGELLTGQEPFPTPAFGPLYSKLAYPIPGGSGVGTTDGFGDASGTIPITFSTTGQQFSIDNIIYTAVLNGANSMLQTGATTAAVYNNTSGAYNFVGAPANKQIYFYPGLPVMSIANYEIVPINNQPAWAFDPSFAYTFTGGRWLQSGAAQWHGDKNNFYWWSNYDGIVPGQTAMFVSNDHVHVGLGLVTDDPVWSYNVVSSPTWQPFSYSPDATLNPTNRQPYTVTRATTGTGAIIESFIESALIVLPFKDRLVMLNTIENNANGATAFVDVAPPAGPPNYTTTGITPATYLTSTNTRFVNRCRFSFNGSPYARNAWLEANQVFKPDTGATKLFAAGGGYIDAPTEEAIVSAEFIKDRLIVYFENSTWELAYTGNQELPFDWQKINTEFGAESPFATVPFDQSILTMATNGITACNGANVIRLDDLIPDQVFNIKSKDMGAGRVVGIRDYDTELVYWSYPYFNVAEGISTFFPNQVFVYNYKTGSWAFNDDCITCFGYFEQQADLTWATATLTWEEYGTQTWRDGIVQAEHRRVIAGNQQGYIFYIAPEISENAPVMSITNLIQASAPSNVLQLDVINHILTAGEYVQLDNLSGITITATGPATEPLYNGILQVYEVINANRLLLAFPNGNVTVTGTYTGGGTLQRVSNINIQSKQWNPYLDIGQSFHLAKIDFGVMKTANGEVTVDYFPSSTQVSMLSKGTGTGALIGNGTLETKPYPIALAPLEQAQERLWHPIYFQTYGNSIQIQISMSNNQMLQPAVAFEEFEIDAMILHTQKMSSRMQ